MLIRLSDDICVEANEVVAVEVVSTTANRVNVVIKSGETVHAQRRNGEGIYQAFDRIVATINEAKECK